MSEHSNISNASNASRASSPSFARKSIGRRATRRTTDAVERLACVAPFDQVDLRALRALAPSTDAVHLRPGTVVARDEAPVHEFVLLVTGALDAFDALGHRRRLLPGATLGGAALAAGDTHHETVVAAVDADVVVVNGPAYRWAVAELLAARS